MPVKNAEGNDSPRTSKDDQLRQFARWAKAASLTVETDSSGLPAVRFEVSPLFADTEERFLEAIEGLDQAPLLEEETVLS